MARTYALKLTGINTCITVCIYNAILTHTIRIYNCVYTQGMVQPRDMQALYGCVDVKGTACLQSAPSMAWRAIEQLATMDNSINTSSPE